MNKYAVEVVMFISIFWLSMDRLTKSLLHHSKYLFCHIIMHPVYYSKSNTDWVFIVIKPQVEVVGWAFIIRVYSYLIILYYSPHLARMGLSGTGQIIIETRIYSSYKILLLPSLGTKFLYVSLALFRFILLIIGWDFLGPMAVFRDM